MYRSALTAPVPMYRSALAPVPMYRSALAPVPNLEGQRNECASDKNSLQRADSDHVNRGPLLSLHNQALPRWIHQHTASPQNRVAGLGFCISHSNWSNNSGSIVMQTPDRARLTLARVVDCGLGSEPLNSSSRRCLAESDRDGRLTRKSQNLRARAWRLHGIRSKPRSGDSVVELQSLPAREGRDSVVELRFLFSRHKHGPGKFMLLSGSSPVKLKGWLAQQSTMLNLMVSFAQPTVVASSPAPWLCRFALSGAGPVAGSGSCGRR
jgi:hypothetical protein